MIRARAWQLPENILSSDSLKLSFCNGLLLSLALSPLRRSTYFTSFDPSFCVASMI